MNDQDRAPRERAKAPMEDPNLSTWYSQPEVVRLLGISRRWLNEQLLAGSIVIERRQRLMQGLPRGSRRKKYETCYKPEDVDRIANAKAAATVFTSISGVGPGAGPPSAIDPRPSEDVSRLFHAAFSSPHPLPILAQAVMEIIARRHAVDRGPWLSIPEAAAHIRLPRAMVRRLALKMLAEKHPDVIQIGNRLKIRQMALGEADSRALSAPEDDCPLMPFSSPRSIGA